MVSRRPTVEHPVPVPAGPGLFPITPNTLSLFFNTGTPRSGRPGWDRPGPGGTCGFLAPVRPYPVRYAWWSNRPAYGRVALVGWWLRCGFNRVRCACGLVASFYVSTHTLGAVLRRCILLCAGLPGLLVFVVIEEMWCEICQIFDVEILQDRQCEFIL